MRRVGQVRRRDQAEKPIVDGLRARGYDVERVSGKGSPDILVRPKGQRGAQAWGFEVKTGKGTRTEAQQITGWPIVRSLDEALSFLEQVIGRV